MLRITLKTTSEGDQDKTFWCTELQMCLFTKVVSPLVSSGWRWRAQSCSLCMGNWMHVWGIWCLQFVAGLVCMASPAAFLEPGSPTSPLQSLYCSSSSAERSRYCPLWTSSETWQVDLNLLYTLDFISNDLPLLQYILHKEHAKHIWNIYAWWIHNFVCLVLWLYSLEPSDQCIVEGNDCTIVSDLGKIKLQKNTETLGM